MQLQYLLATAFAASAFGAKFKNFKDISCQRYDQTYEPVSAAELEQLTVEQYPSAEAIPNATGELGPVLSKYCPANSDNTYKRINVPAWQVGATPIIQATGLGGWLWVTYYKETDTYALCQWTGGADAGGYAGLCNPYSNIPDTGN